MMLLKISYNENVLIFKSNVKNFMILQSFLEFFVCSVVEEIVLVKMLILEFVLYFIIWKYDWDFYIFIDNYLQLYVLILNIIDLLL